MFSNKLILILTFTLIVFLIVAVNNVENVKTDDYEKCLRMIVGPQCFNHHMNSYEIFKSAYTTTIRSNWLSQRKEILTEYREDIYYRVMLILDKESIPSPKCWCMGYTNSAMSNEERNYVESCLSNLSQLFDMTKDGRYALKEVYFKKKVNNLEKMSKIMKKYNDYILKIVEIIINQTTIQSPSQFCSSKRLPKPSSEELARLSELGLGAPSLTNIGVNITPDHLGMTSQRYPGAFSSMEYDLNKTPEQLGMTSQRNPNAFSSMEYDLNKTPEQLGMTSQIDCDGSSSTDYHLDATAEEYNEMDENKKKKKKKIP